MLVSSTSALRAGATSSELMHNLVFGHAVLSQQDLKLLHGPLQSQELRLVYLRSHRDEVSYGLPVPGNGHRGRRIKIARHILTELPHDPPPPRASPPPPL